MILKDFSFFWYEMPTAAMATQAHANLAYGPKGLDLMGKGISAKETIEELTGADEEREGDFIDHTVVRTLRETFG